MYGSTPHLTESGGTGSISAAQIAAQMMSKGGAAAHYGRTQPQQLWAAAQMAAAQLEAMNQNIYAVGVASTFLRLVFFCCLSSGPFLKQNGLSSPVFLNSQPSCIADKNFDKASKPSCQS